MGIYTLGRSTTEASASTSITMFKSIYDVDNNGIVDDSEKLGTQLPSYYLNWGNFTNTPTTESGYGISDGFTSWDKDYNDLINKPTLTANHNDLTSIQGGTTNEYYHLTANQSSNNIVKTGTPVDNQIAVFTDANTIEGTTGLTYAGSTLNVTSLKVDTINEYTASNGVYIDSVLIKDYVIDAQDGVSKHLTITAGDASGAAGTDAGSLYLKAGNAISGDLASTHGDVFLIPGINYNKGSRGSIYIGEDSLGGTIANISVKGSNSNVAIQLSGKGTGAVYIGNQTTGTSLIFGSNNIDLLCPEIRLGYQEDNIIVGSHGVSSHVNGYHISITGGEAYYSGNNNGGNIYIYGGNPTGSGTRGNVYLGNGSSGHLPAKTSETNVVYYDPSTGLLSYGTP